MKQFIYFIGALLVISACQSPQNGAYSGIYTIHAEEAIDSSGEAISLKKIAKSILMIPLETSPTSLLKSVDEITLYKDYMIIVNGGKCSIFNKDGKFITDIGQKGNGPQEYLNVDNAFVKNDTIYLFDSYKGRIHKFTPDNKYISHFDIPSTLKGFRGIVMVGSDEFMAFSPDKGYTHKQKMLTFFNTTGVISDSLLRVSKLSQPSDVNWYFKECTFTQNGAELRYKDVFNDTIYTVENKGGKYAISPKYIFDLGKYKAVVDAREKVSKSFFSAKVYAPFSEMAKIELLGENDKFLFFLANDQRQYFFDKAENKLHKWNLTIPGYETNCLEDATFFTPLQIDKSGNLLGVMKSNDENDNPVVVIAKL